MSDCGGKEMDDDYYELLAEQHEYDVIMVLSQVDAEMEETDGTG